jgi:hypothetical protein
MLYHHPTQQFTVSPDELKHAANDLTYAIKNIRLLAGRDLRGYDNPGNMDHAEFAEDGILQAAKALGINLGATRAGKLDVSER